MAKRKILITCPPMIATLSECAARFEKENFEVVAPQLEQSLSELELIQIIRSYDGVIAGDDSFSARVLEEGKKGRLKAIAKWGVGLDSIDLHRARELGIPVSNTPAVFSDEVADVAIGYLILLSRRLHEIDRSVREGKWQKIQGRSLMGKVAGIIGVGSIGRQVARRLSVMGMRVYGYDVREIEPALGRETGLVQVALDNLLSDSDCIVVCCNLTPQSEYFLDNSRFSAMKDGVWIINVSRGKLIEERALLKSLGNGKVSGAALDVFETEPLSKGHPLLGYPQVILGSHNSSNTREAVLRVNQLVIDNLARDLNRMSEAAPATRQVAGK